MLHIISQYKKLFTEFIIIQNLWWSKLSWAEWLSGDVEAAVKSSDVLTIKEYKALLLKYKDNEAELNKAVSAWIKDNLYVDHRVLDTLKKYNALSLGITEKAIKDKKKLVEDMEDKEVIPEKVSFERTLKKWAQDWNDIKVLQKYLISKWLLKPTYKTRSWEEKSSIDWNFGIWTALAVKKVQEKIYGKWSKFIDGEMTKWGKTMDYITNDINDNLTHEQKDVKYWKKANEIVDHLVTTEKYVTAFNKVYWGTEHFISRDNGLLWIINHLWESDLDKLIDELKDKWFNLDNLDDDKKTKLANDLWIDKNSDKFTDWLKRTAIIATISAIISWGSSVALELFAINYWENLSEWPEISKIIKHLDKKDVSNWLIKEEREALLAKDTTVEWLEAILDHLNNENMDPATMMRLINDIYDPNWFQNTFWIFMPDGYKDVENLIEEFKKTNDLTTAKEFVAKIYTLSYKAVDKATNNRIKEEKDFNELSIKYHEFIKNNPAYILDPDYAELNSDYNTYKYSYESAKKDEQKAKNWFSKLWNIIGRYTNMEAKKDNIQWNKFDVEKARKRESKIDEELGINKLKPISEKLYSKQSFWYSVDVNKLNNSEYMTELINKMKSETINWKTSVISGLIRWIEQHYFWYTETFSAEDFINAFENTAEKTTSEYVLSNLWRDRNQKFQWKITWNLFKIKINGKDIFFRDKCTNIITVANPIETTVKDTNSLPIVWAFDTWFDNAWKSSSEWPKDIPKPLANSNPVDGTPTNIPTLTNQPSN